MKGLAKTLHPETMHVRAHSLLSLSLILLCGACATKKSSTDFVASDVEAPSVFKENTEANAATATGAALGEQWWENFQDPELNRLVEIGFQSSYDLQLYVARIKQANALARQTGSRLYPNLTLSVGYDVEWDGETTAPETRDRTDASDLGALLVWEVDLWGRLSAARRASLSDRDASIEDWKDARLLLSSAIAESYFQLKEQRRQSEVIQSQIEINESLLKLTTYRFGQGQSSIVDVLQQREQLDTSRALVPLIEASIGQTEYTLDALLGKVPGGASLDFDSRLPALPPLPAIGLPISLLENRPDLRAVQKRLESDQIRVLEAIRNRIPTLRLGGGIDWRGDPDFGDAITSAFASLAAPLFDAGDRRAAVRFRRAAVEEALADYSARFLVALSEVEIALLSGRKLQEQHLLLDQQLQTARQLHLESQNRFSQGLTDYLPVFTALNIVQNLERDIVSSQRRVLSARVALHRALGGPLTQPEVNALLSSSHE